MESLLAYGRQRIIQFVAFEENEIENSNPSMHIILLHSLLHCYYYYYHYIDHMKTNGITYHVCAFEWVVLQLHAVILRFAFHQKHRSGTEYSMRIIKSLDQRWLAVDMPPGKYFIINAHTNAHTTTNTRIIYTCMYICIYIWEPQIECETKFCAEQNIFSTKNGRSMNDSKKIPAGK